MRIIVLLALLLAGCATHWSKGGATADDFNRDEYACERDAYAAGGAVILYGGSAVMPTRNAAMKERCLRAKGWSKA